MVSIPNSIDVELQELVARQGGSTEALMATSSRVERVFSPEAIGDGGDWYLCAHARSLRQDQQNGSFIGNTPTKATTPMQ